MGSTNTSSFTSCTVALFIFGVYNTHGVQWAAHGPLTSFVEPLRQTLSRASISQTYPSHFVWCTVFTKNVFTTIRQNKRYKSVSHELITLLHFAPFLLEAENFLEDLWVDLWTAKRGQISLSSFRMIWNRNKSMLTDFEPSRLMIWVYLSVPVFVFSLIHYMM